MGNLAASLLYWISIHALHEESDAGIQTNGSWIRISIHALHEESDLIQTRISPRLKISIHALHEESDPVAVPATRCV